MFIKDLISVVIPVYNGEKVIERCLNSILKQGYKKYEIIVINDGSQDHTGEILALYKVSHPDKFKVIDQENQGQSRARNAGMKAATGEFLIFIDSDDDIASDFLEIYHKNIVDNEADIVIGGCNNCDSITGEILFCDKPSLHQIKTSNNNVFFWGAPWAKIYRTSLLINYNCLFKEGVILEDDPFSILTHSLAKKITTIDYIGYNYYINNPNSTMGCTKNIKSLLGIIPYEAYDDAISNVIANNGNISHLSIYIYAVFTNIIFKKSHGATLADIKKLIYFVLYIFNEHPLQKSFYLQIPLKYKMKFFLLDFLRQTKLLTPVVLLSSKL